MIDQFGREINYMRISVTDRCNLRCRFCMPEEKLCYKDQEQLLSYEELLKTVKAVLPLGIHNFRITGGEPLVREGVIDFIWDLKRLDGVNEVYLTTNGILLDAYLEDLRKAEIDGINISLSSMDAAEYEYITGRNTLEKVIKSIDSCVKSNIHTKINCVSLPDRNTDQLQNIASLARELPVEVRFIEMMPIGQGVSFNMITGEEVLKDLEKLYGKAETNDKVKGSGPAVYYKFKDFAGSIGFINARSCSFCNQCNRIRLTADGWLKLCLNFEEGIDIRKDLLSQMPIEELTMKIKEAIYRKPAQHDFNESSREAYQKNTRYMAQIGG